MRPELGRSGSRSWCSAWLPPGAPRRSWTTAQSWRPRTRSLSPGSAAAAASSRSAGCPPWWGAAARPRSRSGAPRRAGRWQRPRSLKETGWVRSGRRQRVGGVRVSDSEGDLDRLGVDERGAASQRNAADPQGGGEKQSCRRRPITRRAPSPGA